MDGQRTVSNGTYSRRIASLRLFSKAVRGAASVIDTSFTLNAQFPVNFGSAVARSLRNYREIAMRGTSAYLAASEPPSALGWLPSRVI